MVLLHEGVSAPGGSFCSSLFPLRQYKSRNKLSINLILGTFILPWFSANLISYFDLLTQVKQILFRTFTCKSRKGSGETINKPNNKIMDIAKGSKTRELAPKGTHQARCVFIVDLGTQPGSKQFPEEKRKIRLGFEILGEKTKTGKKFVAYKEYVLSNHPKSTLMGDLESWLDVTDKHYNIDNALSQYGNITIKHEESANGGTYDNIKAITALKKNERLVEKGSEPLVSFYMDEAPLDMETFEALPDWLQTKIAGSPEFAELSEGKKGKKEKPAPAKKGKK